MYASYNNVDIIIRVAIENFRCVTETITYDRFVSIVNLINHSCSLSVELLVSDVSNIV